LIPWIVQWETEPRLEDLECFIVARARVRGVETASLHRWNLALTKILPPAFFREEMNALRRIETLSVVTVFPHCIAITRYAGRTGLVTRMPLSKLRLRVPTPLLPSGLLLKETMPRRS